MSILQQVIIKVVVWKHLQLHVKHLHLEFLHWLIVL